MYNGKKLSENELEGIVIKLISLIKHKLLDWRNNSKTMQLTFKLPEQEHGASMFESKSSSWQILHSTSFLGDKQASESLW